MKHVFWRSVYETKSGASVPHGMVADLRCLYSALWSDMGVCSGGWGLWFLLSSGDQMVASESSLSTLIRVLISPNYVLEWSWWRFWWVVFLLLGIGRGGRGAERLRGYVNLEMWESVWVGEKHSMTITGCGATRALHTSDEMWSVSNRDRRGRARRPGTAPASQTGMWNPDRALIEIRR